MSDSAECQDESGPPPPPPPPPAEPAGTVAFAAKEAPESDEEAAAEEEADEAEAAQSSPLDADEEPTASAVSALEDGPLRVVFSAPACPAESVTVFLDRAEVRRLLRLRSRAGETEVVVTDLTPAIDKDSIRVEVKGAATTIADVAYSAVPDETDEAARLAGKADAAAALERERRGLDAAAGRLERSLKQRDVLASYADALVKQPQPVDAGSPYDPRRVATLGGFFDLYESQAARLDDEVTRAREQLRLHQEAMAQLEQQLQDIDGQFGELLHREVRIYLDSRQASDLELQLSYVVSRAKWSPRYDIRVHSNEAIMRIVYHGMVQQSTGEDWNTARISLSTSQPGVGGSAPLASVQKAHFSRCPGKGPQLPSSQKSSKKLKQLQPPEPPATTAPDVAGEAAVSAADEATEPQRMQSTQLEVPRSVRIPADGQSHRVTVTAIDLTPAFEHECVPQRSPFAYLKATVVNTSAYALLPGPANVFVDGCFVAKSELKAAAPSEEFQCHLGADHGLRVVYRPVFRKREASGQQSKVATISHRQAIELHNGHAKPVKLVVLEPLPLACEDKMKVSLLEPVIKHPEKYDRQKPVRLNKSNCVEWELELAGGESRELVMRYNIDLPPGESLDCTTCDA